MIAKNFFTGLDPTSGMLAALALFGAGFFFRPLGALIFGRIGDRVGRKSTFLLTVILMGGSTFAIGVLPTWSQAGAVAPLLLILMRVLQGTALGGEYGGAATFIAEHAPANRRGLATGWVQATAAFGLVGALLAIYLVRHAQGEAAFTAGGWTAGWRIPFLLSAALLAVSVWMRLRLTESPAFAAMRESGTQSKAPFAESFGRWSNLKIVLIALVAIMSAQGAAWYTLFFYAEQVFLERFMKIDPATGTWLLILLSLASAPLYIFFAWLSDVAGRKWVLWGGMTLAAVAFFPAFHELTHLANPALEAAQARTPVVVVADPAKCSFQFDLTGKSRFATSCDIVKSALSNAGISYANRAAPAGSVAAVEVGGATVVSKEAAGLPAPAQKAAAAEVKTRVLAALKAAGYPAKADPARMNFWGVFARADDLRGRLHGAVRPDRGDPGRAVPDAHPLHGDVPALPHRGGLGRGLHAGHRLRHRDRHRQYLFGAVVLGDLHRDQRRHPPVPAA